MGAIREGSNRVRSFFHKPQRDAELDAEIATHVELAFEENMRQGMPEAEARRRALVRFGGVQQAKERQREARGLPWLDILLQDVRYTFRTLRPRTWIHHCRRVDSCAGHWRQHRRLQRSGYDFAAAAAVSRAAAVSPNPEQKIPRAANPARPIRRMPPRNISSGTTHFRRLPDTSPSPPRDNYKLKWVMESAGTCHGHPGDGEFLSNTRRRALAGAIVHGRRMSAEQPSGRVAQLSVLETAVCTAIAASLGKAIDLNGTPVTVVGVLPNTFDFGSVFSPGAKVDIFTPFIMYDFQDDGNVLALMGRLKPGVTLAQAQAEADLLFPKLDFEHGPSGVARGLHRQSSWLKEYVTGKLRRSLIVLWCAVGMILLIVCVNLSNLLLARTAARSKEFAMRSALGAGRGRLIRQLLTESLILSGAGALLGLGIAFAVIEFLAHQGSIALPLLSSVRIDGAALAWTVVIAVVSGAAFGLAPGLKMSAGNLQETLKDSGGGGE